MALASSDLSPRPATELQHERRLDPHEVVEQRPTCTRTLIRPTPVVGPHDERPFVGTEPDRDGAGVVEPSVVAPADDEAAERP